jgi:hypothetical protein
LLAVILGLRKFEHILRARKFLIRTDSSAITFLQGLKEARGIFARWLVYLSSFDFDIHHRPGKVNTAADALSRTVMPQEEQDGENQDEYLVYPEIDDVYLIRKQSINQTVELDGETFSEFHMTPVEKKNWELETKKDYPLQLVVKLVKEGKMPEQTERKHLPPSTNSYLNWFNFLYIKDDLLYIQKPISKNNPGPPRICVPRSMQKELVELAHAGHRGVTETLEKLRARAYFPGMDDLARLIVINCVQCIQKSNSIPSTKNKVQHHETLGYPFQRVYLDTVGPLTPCRYKGSICKHILTIQDGFTRHLVAIPVSDLEAKTLLSALIDRVFLVHGLPETIHTDNGSSLMSNLFQDTCKQMGVMMTQTPTYSPQGNRVERAHQTLGQILRSDDTFNPSSWAQKVDAAVFEINISRNRITGVSPYYAMYGRNPRIPLDVFFPDKHMQSVMPWTKFVLNLSNHFEKIHKEMAKHEKLYIPVASEVKIPRGSKKISIGNIVYYMSPKSVLNLSRKLTLRWTGPYRVTNTPSDSLAVIDPIGGWAINRRELHVLTSRLKKVDPDYSKLVSEQVDLDQLDKGSEEEEISFQVPDEPISVNPRLRQTRETDIDSSEDEEGHINQGIQRVPIPMETSENIYPHCTPHVLTEDPIIVQPSMIKTEMEPEESLPQNRMISTEVVVQPQVPTRRYTRRPLPPPREGREGARREAFSRAMKHIQENLKKKK